MYQPFITDDLSCFIIASEQSQFGAFQFKQLSKVGRSHIIFQLKPLGLLIGYLQYNKCYNLRTEFQQSLQISHENGQDSQMFEFEAPKKSESV